MMACSQAVQLTGQSTERLPVGCAAGKYVAHDATQKLTAMIGRSGMQCPCPGKPAMWRLWAPPIPATCARTVLASACAPVLRYGSISSGKPGLRPLQTGLRGCQLGMCSLQVCMA
jgi:hypothetical protein